MTTRISQTPTPSLELRVEQLVTARQQLKASLAPLLADLEATEKALKVELETIDGPVDIGVWRVSYTPRERRSLDRVRLAELGVATDVLEAAEKVTAYRQLDIKERRGE